MAVYMSNEAVKAYLLARVTQEPGGCWLWTCGVDRRGYGLAWVNGRRERAARIAFKVFVGPIPDDYDMHHTCPHRRCINPEHLRPMPHGEHMRLHCASGSWWAGSKNSQAKITEADAQFIKTAKGLLPAQTLADQFGIGVRNVQHIWSREGWPHVGLPNLPPRPLTEVLQDGRGAAKKALNVLQSLQQDRRERGETQPPNIEHIITLASFCAGQ